MQKTPTWEYIRDLAPKQSDVVRTYFERYGITDLRQVWRALRTISKTYYDIIRANCEGTPIDWAAE